MPTSVKLKKYIHHSETKLKTISLEDIIFLYASLKDFFSSLFFFKIIYFFFFKIDNLTLDPEPNWAKTQYPDQNSMYLDPQHCESEAKK